MNIKKLLPILLVLSIVLFSLSGCGAKQSSSGQNSSNTPQKTEITFVSGGAGGPYHVIASALASLWNEKIQNINVTNSSTAASVVNLRMINENKAQIAFTMSDVAYLASKGQEMFKEPLGNVMGFASLHDNYVQLITKKDSNINSVYDLKGKRVGVGAPGSGTEFNARGILKAAGMTYNDLAKADYLSYAETCEQLANGNIDAGFITGGLPVAAITELATTKDIKIVPIAPEIIEKLKQEYPIYFEAEIPAGVYKGVDSPVKTVALKNYIVINKDVPEDLAYNLIKTMFDNWESVKQAHSALKDVSIEKATEHMVLPLHPGVEKFYREKGIIK
ncbi:MAG: TAXI family TRAP transporter solute-binding subunit [Thermovenabulum sp.]|uniref:TAXI family TRAP transporter solute-binding subunit n=1 Tax=Thermovenabulum sp. TaxID=3100335 RepID=UPI003C7D7266